MNRDAVSPFSFPRETRTSGSRRSVCRLLFLSTKAPLVLCTLLTACAAQSQQPVTTPSTRPSEWVGSTGDPLPSLRNDLQCMVNVLASTPRIDHVRSGVSQTDGHIEVFVEYRYHESNSHRVVRFVADQSASSKNSVYFLTYLNGLMTPGSPGPPDYGTGKIARLWKLKCQVDAYEVFE